MTTAPPKTKALSPVHLAAAGTLMIAAVIAGFSLGGSPKAASGAAFAPSRDDMKAPHPLVVPLPALPGVGSNTGPSAPDQGAANTTTAEQLAVKIRSMAARLTALQGQRGLAPTSEAQSRRTAFEVLADLHQCLRDAPPSVAAAAISAYLDSKADVSTGLDFFAGADGALVEAPSLRTALLDALAGLDASKSAAYAHEVLAQPQSPGEWALAMRDLARQNADGSHTAELSQALEKMLDNQDWLRTAPRALLEALDVAVALGGPAEFQNLGSVLHLQDASGGPAGNGISNAAATALERMTYRNPAQTVRLLEADPSLLAWAPEERGGLMARANTADPGQRAAVESYLLRTDLPPEEVHAFASTFPNSTAVLGGTLVSNEVTVQDAVNAAEALALVEQWRRDPRFQARRAELQQISERLAGEARAAAAMPPGPPASVVVLASSATGS